jgi:hypothetical protein
MYLLQQQNMVRKIAKPLAESNVVGLETKESEKTDTPSNTGSNLDKGTGLKTETANVQSSCVVDETPPRTVATI